MPAADWLEGPLVLGVGWKISEHLVLTAAALAAALGQHLVCAFVDPASYLTEWEPDGTRTALSLDPVINEEADFPSGDLLAGLTAILGSPGEAWSFRVLNGDVAKALCRLAESTGASLLVVGAGGHGTSGWVDRLLQGSVWGNLTDGGRWPVLVVPEAA